MVTFRAVPGHGGSAVTCEGMSGVSVGFPKHLLGPNSSETKSAEAESHSYPSGQNVALPMNAGNARFTHFSLSIFSPTHCRLNAASLPILMACREVVAVLYACSLHPITLSPLLAVTESSLN